MRWGCPEIPTILWTPWDEVFPPIPSLPIILNDFGSNNTAPNKTWMEDSARLDDLSQSLDLWEVLLDLGILRTAQQIWNVDAERSDWAEGHQHSKVNPGMGISLSWIYQTQTKILEADRGPGHLTVPIFQRLKQIAGFKTWPTSVAALYWIFCPSGFRLFFWNFFFHPQKSIFYTLK